MGFLTSLFGGENSYVTMAVALAIVLVLIVLAVWLIKLVGQASQTVGRGRNRRLAVIDSVAIDQKRQAIIIRRDNVEHLIVTGGPNDLVVESGFEPPAQPAMRQPRKPVAAVEAPAETSTPVANVARLNGLGGNGAPKSLRHTGLLRPAETEESELPGGKPDKRGPALYDSGTNGSGLRQEPAFETVAEPGDSDYAEDGQTQRK